MTSNRAQTTRNARRDGSRPSADRDTRRVAPAGAARYWLAQLLLLGLAPGSGQWTGRQPRRTTETACAPTQGGSWLEARGSHSVNQSLSRPAARHEVGSTSVARCIRVTYRRCVCGRVVTLFTRNARAGDYRIRYTEYETREKTRRGLHRRGSCAPTLSSVALIPESWLRAHPRLR